MKHENLLIVADSDRNADLLYAIGFASRDTIVFLRIKDRSFLLLPDLELARGRRLARRCRILSLSAYHRRLRDSYRGPISLAHVIREVLREHRLKKILVPTAFPLALARDLRNLKVKLRIKELPLFPHRQFKTANEIKKISAALTMGEVGLAEGLLALRTAKITRHRQLGYHNVPLTCDKLRAIIDTAVLQAGGTPPHTIVAGGRQACDPNEPGHGPLRANEPIVIDVSSRSRKTGYHANLTRTVVRGRASEPVRKLYDTVRRAQDFAFTQLRSKPTALALHELVQRFFDQEGYPTRSRNGRSQGFFHPTGHGLGLDPYECPNIGPESTDRLSAGQVVTLEPGLYYPNLGGVRLEDVVQLTYRGPHNLTKFEKLLEL